MTVKCKMMAALLCGALTAVRLASAEVVQSPYLSEANFTTTVVLGDFDSDSAVLVVDENNTGHFLLSKDLERKIEYQKINGGRLTLQSNQIKCKSKPVKLIGAAHTLAVLHEDKTVTTWPFDGALPIGQPVDDIIGGKVYGIALSQGKLYPFGGSVNALDTGDFAEYQIDSIDGSNGAFLANTKNGTGLAWFSFDPANFQRESFALNKAFDQMFCTPRGCIGFSRAARQAVLVDRGIFHLDWPHDGQVKSVQLRNVFVEKLSTFEPIAIALMEDGTIKQVSTTNVDRINLPSTLRNVEKILLRGGFDFLEVVLVLDKDGNLASFLQKDFDNDVQLDLTKKYTDITSTGDGFIGVDADGNLQVEPTPYTIDWTPYMNKKVARLVECSQATVCAVVFEDGSVVSPQVADPFLPAGSQVIASNGVTACFKALDGTLRFLSSEKIVSVGVGRTTPQWQSEVLPVQVLSSSFGFAVQGENSVELIFTYTRSNSKTPTQITLLDNIDQVFVRANDFLVGTTDGKYRAYSLENQQGVEVELPSRVKQVAVVQGYCTVIVLENGLVKFGEPRDCGTEIVSIRGVDNVLLPEGNSLGAVLFNLKDGSVKPFFVARRFTLPGLQLPPQSLFSGPVKKFGCFGTSVCSALQADGKVLHFPYAMQFPNDKVVDIHFCVNSAVYVMASGKVFAASVGSGTEVQQLSATPSVETEVVTSDLSIFVALRYENGSREYFSVTARGKVTLSLEDVKMTKPYNFREFLHLTSQGALVHSDAGVIVAKGVEDFSVVLRNSIVVYKLDGSIVLEGDSVLRSQSSMISQWKSNGSVYATDDQGTSFLLLNEKTNQGAVLGEMAVNYKFTDSETKETTDDDEMGVGLIAGIVVGSVAAISLLGVVMAKMRNRKTPSVSGANSTVINPKREV